MFRAVWLQIGLTLFLCLMTWVFFDVATAMFIAYGGAAAFVPNAWFAWKLSRSAERTQGTQAVAFFIGESTKVISTIVLLAATPFLFGQVNWPAMLLGLGVALHAGLFALLIS